MAISVPGLLSRLLLNRPYGMLVPWLWPCIMHCYEQCVRCTEPASILPLAGSNVTSVAEDEVMRILILIRNYLPARDQIVSGNWDVPAVAVNSWDLIDKTVGTVGGGRIGYHMMKRLRVSAPSPPPHPNMHSHVHTIGAADIAVVHLHH